MNADPQRTGLVAAEVERRQHVGIGRAGQERPDDGQPFAGIDAVLHHAAGAGIAVGRSAARADREADGLAARQVARTGVLRIGDAARSADRAHRAEQAGLIVPVHIGDRRGERTGIGEGEGHGSRPAVEHIDGKLVLSGRHVGGRSVRDPHETVGCGLGADGTEKHGGGQGHRPQRDRHFQVTHFPSKATPRCLNYAAFRPSFKQILAPHLRVAAQRRFVSGIHAPIAVAGLRFRSDNKSAKMTRAAIRPPRWIMA